MDYFGYVDYDHFNGGGIRSWALILFGFGVLIINGRAKKQVQESIRKSELALEAKRMDVLNKRRDIIKK